jgi:hypothetical protein
MGHNQYGWRSDVAWICLMSLGGAIAASTPREAPIVRDELVIKSVTYRPALAPAMFDDVSSTASICLSQAATWFQLADGRDVQLLRFAQS